MTTALTLYYQVWQPGHNENQGNASVIFRSSHSRCKSKLTRNPVLMYNQEQPEKWVSIIQSRGSFFIFFVVKKKKAKPNKHIFTLLR